MPLNFRKKNSPLGLYMVLEQVQIWHSQYASGQCTSAAVECCGLKGGRGAGAPTQAADVLLWNPKSPSYHSK